MRRIVNESVLVLNKYFLAVQVSNVQNAIGALVTKKARVVDEGYISYSLEEWIDFTKKNKYLGEVKDKYAGLVRSPSVCLFAPQVIFFSDCEYTSPLIKTVRYSRKNIYQRDEYTCQYCSKKYSAKDLNIDHVVPKSRGGPNSWKNIVTSCLPCNAEKGDKLLMELGWKPIQEPKRPKWKSHVGKPFDPNKSKYWETFLK